jgi:anion-transporting  ArsA/GET3 family ATPase
MLVRDGRVVLVTGKGGVGKTTVAAAFALAVARMGRRVLLCETAGSTAVPRLFGRVGKGYEPTEMAPNLWTMVITSEAAIEDYVVQQIRFRKLYQLVFRNRVMAPFVDAVPGLHDLIQLGAVWDAERKRERGRPLWDLVVVDAPATGHGLTMLHAPRAMMDLTMGGPFHQNAKLVAELIEDPRRTSLLLVSLPEELPVNETLQLYQGLDDLQPLVRGIVLNEVHPPPVPDPPVYRMHHDALLAGANPAGAEAIDLADAGLERITRQAVARARLSALGAPVVDLPFLFRREVGPEDLATLSRGLERL